MMNASLLSLSSHAHQQIIRDTFSGNQVDAVVKVKKFFDRPTNPSSPFTEALDPRFCQRHTG